MKSKSWVEEIYKYPESLLQECTCSLRLKNSYSKVQKKRALESEVAAGREIEIKSKPSFISQVPRELVCLSVDKQQCSLRCAGGTDTAAWQGSDCPGAGLVLAACRAGTAQTDSKLQKCCLKTECLL